MIGLGVHIKKNYSNVVCTKKFVIFWKASVLRVQACLKGMLFVSLVSDNFWTLLPVTPIILLLLEDSVLPHKSFGKSL